MKRLQTIVMAGLICLGIVGMTGAASAAPLAGQPALGTTQSGGLVVEVRNGNNAAIAAGAALAIIGGAAIVSSQQHHYYRHDDRYYHRRHYRRYDDDDDGVVVRVHCRYGTFVDHRGVRRCRP